ncbi:MAG: TonB-dependent receptor plug domain-containing protein, partial [Pseudomonadota bacterium]
MTAGSRDASAGADAGTVAKAESVVTARRVPAAAAREDMTAAASVLDPADSPRARDDLGTLLLEVPGANITRRGGFGSFATVSLRGANPDEVRIYVDGIPLNQAVGGAVDLSTLPLGDVERIEVYRGSSPISFGESALGGVISISTRTPGAPSASARVGGGSFQTMFADATASGGAGGLKVYGGVHLVRAAGDFPQTAPGITGGYQPGARENNDLSQWDGVFRAALDLPGRRTLRAGLIGILREQGLPTAENFRATAARATTARGMAHLGYESRDDLGPSGRLRVTLFASGMRESFSDPLAQVVSIPSATRDVTRA